MLSVHLRSLNVWRVFLGIAWVQSSPRVSEAVEKTVHLLLYHCMAAAMAGTTLGGFRSRSRTCTLLYTVSGVQVQMYRCIYICTDVHMYRYRDLQMKLYLFQKKVSLIASGPRCPCPAEWAQEPGQCCKRQCCIGSAVFRLCCAVKVSAVLCAA